MKENVIIPGQGLFVKSDSYEEVASQLLKESLKIGRTTLIPEQRFNLDGFFNITSPVYVGYEFHNTNAEAMLYYNGFDDSSLFGKHFFEVIYRISDKRIFCMYSDRGGRDYNFINNCWDWERRKQKNRHDQ